MTSSLVGSEMCIRDRSGSSSPATRAITPDWCCAPRARAESLKQCLSKSCLLYTSDAADDM
eukprot:7633805-Prorocentrum_lima.AAC.1